MIRVFDPLIYPQLVWVSDSPTTGEYKFDSIGEFNHAEAMVDCVIEQNLNRGGVLIRFENKSKMTTPIITHEAIHAALAILDYCGIQIVAGNDEPLAYLAGWIAKCCTEVKGNKKNKS